MKTEIPKGLVLSYVGLPQNWAEVDGDELNEAVEINVAKALNRINSTSKGGVVLVNGFGGYMTNLLTNEVGIDLVEQVKGYDFAKYFSSKFNKDEHIDVLAKKFTFVYNVGDEEALKRDYSSQLLKSLMKKVRSENCWLFIVTDLSKTDFERMYNIQVANTIRLPQPKEVKVF